MKTYFTLLYTAIGLTLAAQLTSNSFDFDGQTRDYLTYVPSIYNGTTQVPLVICLHGLGDNMSNFTGIGMNYVADTANFIVMTPQALVDGLFGSTAWNSGAGMLGITLNPTVNDIGFLSALIDTISSNYNIDQKKIYACGFSMGGFMSQRLACDLNDKVAAIASVAGTIGSGLTCIPGRAVPICHFHGTADGTVSYTGNSYGTDAEATVDFWTLNNNCNTSSVNTTTLPDLFADGYTVDHSIYSGCDDNT